MKRFLSACRRQLLPGLCLGLALTLTTLFALSSFADDAIALWGMQRLPLLLAVCCAVGVILMVWHRRTPHPRQSAPFLSGLTAPYLISLVVLLWMLFFRLSEWAVLERCVLFGLLLLLALWLTEYGTARRMAKQLNHALGARLPSAMAASLIVDLEECPKGAEAFCVEIERYCLKNHISCQFIERSKPAVVVMDGVRHRVELGVYYGYVPGWFLKFTEL